jgi:hypothetical protein
MNTKWPKTVTAGIMATGMIILGCTSLDTMGPGSETVAIAGRVVDSLGHAVPEARVVLLPARYNPLTDPAIPDTMVGITDDAGHYTMKAPGTGAYSVEAADGNSKCKALVTGINVDKKDTVTVPESMLRRPGALRVVLPDTVNDASGYVYLPGTTCYASVQNGIATVDAVPAGFIPSVNYANTAVPDKNHVIQANLTVLINDTLVIMDIISWKYSKKLYLNTTAGGASVGQNVYDFPVLVRLTSVNIDFSLAKSDGSDIRFTKSNGAPLPYEIERWDAGARAAEIWVRVDTVYGDAITQSLTMYWGNPNATYGSNSAAVFDTASGFAGVWHLGEDGDNVFDATAHAFNGMNSGSTPMTGMVGNARNFANGDYIKITGLLKTPANVTMSAWVSSDTLNWGQNNNWGQEIVSIGDYALIRLDDAYGIGTSGWYQNQPIGPGPDSSFVMVKSKRFLANTGWHFIVFSINTTSHAQVLYIDGVQCAIANDSNPICYSGLGSDTYIGIHGNGEKIYNFSGLMDEVRVNNISLSSDWIKLCFMNQKERDALVKW